MTSPRILIVDDEADLRELLELTFLKMGMDVDSAETLSAARTAFAAHDYSMILTDMRLPDGQGIELVREVSASQRNIPIAVLTAFGSADNAVAALKAGAFDYLSKPVRLDQLRQMVHSALRSTKAPPIDDGANGAGSVLRLLGNSEPMSAVQGQIVRLARSMAPVAITGESGTGKELAARDIHAQSSRADQVFVAVNCGAIPESLMEAEFFGYRKGSFTGAADDREGFFQAANGGTLMLDEVADLPLTMQVKLLRAIQERRVRRIGATQEEAVDVRLISATHQNLAACVEQGRFRQDLYYRLNVIELRLPPLRERREDIGLLAQAILQRLSVSGTVPTLSDAALAALEAYAFPGNVRELENVLERALAFSNGASIELSDLALKPVLSDKDSSAHPIMASGTAAVTSVRDPGSVGSTSLPLSGMAASNSSIGAGLHGGALRTGEKSGDAASMGAATQPMATGELPRSLPEHLDEVEREIILRALDRTGFNRTQAADLLGISFRQLRYRMQRLAISEPD